VLAYLAADNELARRANPDQAQLAALVAQVQQVDAELAALAAGSEARLAELLASVNQGTREDPGPQLDKAEELQAKWQVKPGQLWRLGEHQLLCGDAKIASIVCDFAIFDPPWDWSHGKQSEAMDWVSWKNCLLMGRSECFPLSTRAEYRCFWVWDQMTGANISNASPYLPQRTLVLMLMFGEAKRFWRDQGLSVLHAAGIAKQFVAVVPQYIRIVRKYTDGGEVGYSDVKPDLLCDYVIALHSQKGETVGDPFCGSGSFLMACERLGRKCIGAEIEPQGVAVSLDRWSLATGKTPALVSDH
jgi:hypothetical protein